MRVRRSAALVASALLTASCLGAQGQPVHVGAPAEVMSLPLREEGLAAAAAAAGASAVASVTPEEGSVAGPGAAVIVDFHRPMDEASVLVRIHPVTPFWWYWDGPMRIVVLPKMGLRPDESYQVQVAGLLSGSAQPIEPIAFDFRTGGLPSLATGTNVLAYHINGRPRPGEVGANFVDRDSFERQLDELQALGYRFGTLDSGCRGRTVCLTFDDGWATQYPAAQLLARLRIPATFFITVDLLGRKGFLSEQQVRAIAEMGMPIGSHLLTHDCLMPAAARLPPASRAEYLERQLGASQRLLESLTGRPVRYLAYPHGCYDEHVIQLAERFYRGAFTTDRIMPLAPGMEAFARMRVMVRDGTRFGPPTFPVPGARSPG